ncbi:hypothetical protein AHAS_Ahas13G0375300 [Arachis hypogaea]
MFPESLLIISVLLLVLYELCDAICQSSTRCFFVVYCVSCPLLRCLLEFRLFFRMKSGKGKKPAARPKQPASHNVVVLSHPDMEIPAWDSTTYTNKYCETQGRLFNQKKKLHFERMLQLDKLPPDLHKMVNEHIETRGWSFLERKLVDINESWVLEFYANFFSVTLKIVLLRGKQVSVTEASIAEILQIPSN